MGYLTKHFCGILCALALGLSGSAVPFHNASAQTSDTVEDSAEQPAAVKKKKRGKKTKGKKKSPKSNIGDPDANIEFDTDSQTMPIESSGSAWVFLFSMITFMGGVIFWYRKYQAGESAKHLSDLNFGTDDGAGSQSENTGTERSEGKKKHPLEAEQPVFAESSGLKTPSSEQKEKMVSGSDLNPAGNAATVLIQPDQNAYNQPSRPEAATMIIPPQAATRIISPETVEAKPIKKK